jgi:hypothetical protein
MSVEDDFGLWERELKSEMPHGPIAPEISASPTTSPSPEGSAASGGGRASEVPGWGYGRPFAADGAPGRRGPGGRGMIAAAAVVASGCAMLIALGEAPLGIAGLILSSLILLLWRIGM